MKQNKNNDREIQVITYHRIIYEKNGSYHNIVTTSQNIESIKKEYGINDKDIVGEYSFTESRVVYRGGLEERVPVKELNLTALSNTLHISKYKLKKQLNVKETFIIWNNLI